MKQEVIKLEEVNKFNDIFGLETLHPMVSVVDLSKAKEWPETLTINYGVYAVYLKKTKCGDLTYGMQEYDYDEGTGIRLRRRNYSMFRTWTGSDILYEYRYKAGGLRNTVSSRLYTRHCTRQRHKKIFVLRLRFERSSSPVRR